MKIQTLILLAMVAMTGVVACSKNEPPADNVTPKAATPASDAAAVPAPAPAPTDVSFTVEPGNVYACEGRDRTTSVVKWNVSRPGVKWIKVLVSAADDPEKKTLAAMAPIGEASTGNWVAAGVKIELVDGDTGAELASHTVTALPCE